MPKIIIIPDRQVESVCRNAITFANACQSDFDFYLIPQTQTEKSPFTNYSLEFSDGLKYLETLKAQFGYQKEDLVLTFYNGILKASSHGLSNLFCAGANIEDEFPCTGIISLKYLNWNILEEKYNYEVQKHSILHLVVCSIIGSYTKLKAHKENIGCLLDLNLDLTAFNLKLQRGYYLCSEREFGCYDKLKNEKFGNSIIRLCEKFRTSNYQTIINNIMGDNYNIETGFGIGPNATVNIANNQVNNYKTPDNLNFDALESELLLLQEKVLQSSDDIKQSEKLKIASSVAVALEETKSEQKDKNKIVKSLLDGGKWLLNVAKDIGVKVVTDLIEKNAGIK